MIWLFGERENWRPGVYFDAKYVSAHSRRTKTPQLPYGAKYFVLADFSVFQLFPLLDPYWSPTVPALTKDETLTFQDRFLRCPDFRCSRFFFLRNIFEKYVGEISRNK